MTFKHEGDWGAHDSEVIKDGVDREVTIGNDWGTFLGTMWIYYPNTSQLEEMLLKIADKYISRGFKGVWQRRVLAKLSPEDQKQEKLDWLKLKIEDGTFATMKVRLTPSVESGLRLPDSYISEIDKI